MKKHLCLSAALFLALTGFASAQLTTDKGARSDQIQIKLHKMELLARIMPLALTKEQLNQLYPVIEKVRMEQKKVLALEDDELAKLEPTIDSAIKDAYDKGVYPSRDSLATIFKTLNALTIHRQVVMGALADDFYTKVKSVFNQGQMTIMAKAVRDDQADANKDKDKDKPKDDAAQAKKDEDNTKTFIKVVFLDPAAYEVLIQLGKTPAGG